MRNKAVRELEVFREFLLVCELFDHGAVSESRLPPEPDILLTQASGNVFAFELVEILDRPYAASLQREFDTKRLCDDAIAELPATEGAHFKTEFANAHISLSFIGNISTQGRKNALPKLFLHLLTLPPGYEGKVRMPAGSLMKQLQYVTIDRLGIVGPLFAATTGTWVSDPTVEAIEEKLEKSYRTSAPLNLLAYIAGNPMFPESVWIPKLNTYLATLDATTQFENIYVYDTRSKSIKARWHRAP